MIFTDHFSALDLLIVLSTFSACLNPFKHYYGASTLLLNFASQKSNRTKISLPNNWIGKVIHSHFLHLDSRLFITFVGGQPVSLNVSGHCLNPSKRFYLFFSSLDVVQIMKYLSVKEMFVQKLTMIS